MSKLVHLDASDEAVGDASRYLVGVKNGIEKVTMRAINRSLDAGKTALSRGVRDHYTVKKSTVHETLTVKRASQTRLQGSIESRGGPLPMRDFRHSPSDLNTTGKNRKPIRVSIKRGSSERIWGFKWQPSKKVDRAHVYTRVKGAKRRAGTDGIKRVPIEKKFSLSVPQMSGQSGVQEAVQERVREVFEERMEHETDRLLERGAK